MHNWLIDNSNGDNHENRERYAENTEHESEAWFNLDRKEAESQRYHERGQNVQDDDSGVGHSDSVSHWVPPVLFHWTEARMAPYLHDQGFPRQGVYLTTDDDVDKLNPDVPQMLKPLRVAIDTAHLDHSQFGNSDSEGYGGSPESALAAQGNVYYKGTIPKEAILGMDKVGTPDKWDLDPIVPESVGYEWGL